MRTFLTGAMIFIAVLIAAMLLRAFLGPRYTDRLVAVNLISTLGLCEVFLLVVLTHKKNIRRLLHGQENRTVLIQLKKKRD